MALYVTGHVIAALASLIMERWILRKCWGYPTHFMFKAHSGEGCTQEDDSSGEHPRKRDRVIEILAPGYTRSYSDGFIALFDQMLGRLVRSESSKPLDGLHDRFWLSWEYISLRHPAAYRRATHFLELYGFSRNSSMALLLSSLIPVLPGWGAPVQWWAWCLVCLGSGIALWANYVKLLRRMNDEVFRGFAVAASLEFSGPVA